MLSRVTSGYSEVFEYGNHPALSLGGRVLRLRSDDVRVNGPDGVQRGNPGLSAVLNEVALCCAASDSSRPCSSTKRISTVTAAVYDGLLTTTEEGYPDETLYSNRNTSRHYPDRARH